MSINGSSSLHTESKIQLVLQQDLQKKKSANNIYVAQDGKHLLS